MAGARIYSIGYGTRTLFELVKLLVLRDIDLLIDVRSSPYSKFAPDYNRSHLADAVAAEGIEYQFMGDALGGFASDEDYLTDGKVDYSKLSQRPIYKNGINRLVEIASLGRTFCIMCSEEKPEMCHRSKMIGETLLSLGISVIHIDEEGIEKSQEEIIERLTGGQLSLFELSFTSRKKF